MGWETHTYGRYYYKKRRINGRVVSEYVGTGELAGLVAKLNEIDQQRRLLEQAQRREELAELTRLDSQVDDFCATVKEIVKAVLLATGHHQHKRQWRKRKMTKFDGPGAELANALDRVQNNKATPADKKVMKHYIDTTPNGWELAGDLYGNAVTSTLETMSGGKSSGWLLEVSVKKRLEDLKTGMGYDTGSPIERILIEQIALCWLRVYWLENVFSQNIRTMSLTMEWHYEKRLTLSQRRFNRAVETLARVRWLARRTPEVLQINFAQQQQVNIS